MSFVKLDESVTREQARSVALWFTPTQPRVAAHIWRHCALRATGAGSRDVGALVSLFVSLKPFSEIFPV